MFTRFQVNTHLRHLQVTKFVPQILDGVETNDRGTEETDPFDTADTADAQSSQAEPGIPFQREASILEAVESCPAQRGCEGEAEKHGIQKNEAGNGRIRVLKENHQADQPDGGPAEIQIASSVVGERDTDDAKQSIEGAHKSIVHIFRVLLAGLELKGSVVAGKVARKANKHLTQGRMNIEVEFALQIVRTELSEARSGQSGSMCVVLVGW